MIPRRIPPTSEEELQELFHEITFGAKSLKDSDTTKWIVCSGEWASKLVSVSAESNTMMPGEDRIWDGTCLGDLSVFVHTKNLTVSGDVTGSLVVVGRVTERLAVSGKIGQHVVVKYGAQDIVVEHRVGGDVAVGRFASTRSLTISDMACVRGDLIIEGVVGQVVCEGSIGSLIVSGEVSGGMSVASVGLPILEEDALGLPIF